MTYAAPQNISVMHFPIADDGRSAPALMKAAPRLCAFIDSARDGGGVCFCHCRAGISRSATVVLYYLMSGGAAKETRSTAMSLSAALTHLKSVRPMVSPNRGFMDALCQAETELRGGTPSVDIACYHQHRLGK
jgi:protein-tyrosine phosphatase